MSKHTFERGAVSLFIVIFTALLVTTITVAFVRLMVVGQQQATMSDLSKSALDSAVAGVEDAKRAIVYCTGSGAGVGTPACDKFTNTLADGTHCNTLQLAEIAGSPDDEEVLIKQNEGDEMLQQAYTCVKVKLNTLDVVGRLTPDTTRLIPLDATTKFDTVDVEWFSQKDLVTVNQSDSSAGDATIDLGLDAKLPKKADWQPNRPALMRVQLIQFGSNFKLSDFNSGTSENMNNATLFLMPSRVGAPNDSVNFTYDIRKSHTSGALQQIACEQNFSSVSTNGRLYACKAKIKLPNPIGATDGNSRRAFLRINALYAPNTSYRVSMSDATNPVTFRNVQPLVDSTGRANDLFRRVQSRIEFNGSSIPYAEAAIDLTGSLCKTFLVTDDEKDFAPGTCTDS